MMRGYWRDPELTAEVVDAGGWLHTGDLASVGDDGNLHLVGRLKEMYIRGGYNVYPAEVEGVLAEHPAVRRVAIVGAPDPVLGEIGVAFVVPAPGVDAARRPRRVPGLCRGRLADYKAPDRVVVVDALPVNPMLKIDKDALAACVAESVTPPIVLAQPARGPGGRVVTPKDRVSGSGGGGGVGLRGRADDVVDGDGGCDRVDDLGVAAFDAEVDPSAGQAAADGVYATVVLSLRHRSRRRARAEVDADEEERAAPAGLQRHRHRARLDRELRTLRGDGTVAGEVQWARRSELREAVGGRPQREVPGDLGAPALRGARRRLRPSTARRARRGRAARRHDRPPTGTRVVEHRLAGHDAGAVEPDRDPLGVEEHVDLLGHRDPPGAGRGGQRYVRRRPVGERQRRGGPAVGRRAQRRGETVPGPEPERPRADAVAAHPRRAPLVEERGERRASDAPPAPLADGDPLPTHERAPVHDDPDRDLRGRVVEPDVTNLQQQRVEVDAGRVADRVVIRIARSSAGTVGRSCLPPSNPSSRSANGRSGSVTAATRPGSRAPRCAGRRPSPHRPSPVPHPSPRPRR